MNRIPVIIALGLLTNFAFAGDYRPANGIPVENQFIVVLKDDTPSPQAREALLQGLVSAHGGKLTHVYQQVLNGGVVQMSDGKAKGLSHHPMIDYIEQDMVQQIIVPTSSTTPAYTQSSATWGLDRIDQQSLPLNKNYTYDYTGNNVTAYVIDTGILTTHTEFGVRAAWGVNFAKGQNTDCNGHGTHVAGTIGGKTYGVAKAVKLVAVKVLNCNGSGTTTGVIAGIDWVTSNASKPAVANMSLGGGVSSSLDTAVQKSIVSGINYVIAAGNSNADACSASPAKVNEALTVGATESNDARASYSNYGACLDVFAPGSSITSAWIGSNAKTNTISGTSMATPHVAGVVALYLQQNPSANPADVATAIINAATPDKMTSQGADSPNKLLYSIFATP